VLPTEEETVAVKMTDWPNTEGFRFETNVVAVAAAFTVWLQAAELLPVKFASPL
jgi:hypothetical protein